MPAAQGWLKHCSVHGFRITETAPTFMRPYTVPSGGDWTIHRGGAVLLDGTDSSLVTDCTFDQVAPEIAS